MIGNEVQRPADVIQVPGDFHLRRRFGNLTKEFRVVIQAACDIKSSLHIARFCLAMNVLSKRRDVSDPKEYSAHYVYAPVTLIQHDDLAHFRCQTSWIFAKATSAIVLFARRLGLGIQIILKGV